MAVFNFADSYKAAGLLPGPDIIGRRKQSFEILRDQIDTSRIIDLTRLYFGLPMPRGLDWFREAFAEHDPSFTMFDNAREAAVLAACLLAATIADDQPFASLALLTAGVAGHRRPVLNPELVEDARQDLYSKALGGGRAPEHVKIVSPVESKIPELSDALIASPDWAQVANLFKVGAEACSAQVEAISRHLANQLVDFQRQVDMLWWFIGGWSRLLEKPFAELDKALAAVMAGLDLGDLAKEPVGPLAAPAILQRLLSGSPQKKLDKVTIRDAVEALPREALSRIKAESVLKDVPDFCPILTAFLKAAEIGESPSWFIPFRVASQIDPEAQFLPLELAMQVYREKMLLKSIG